MRQAPQLLRWRHNGETCIQSHMMDHASAKPGSCAKAGSGTTAARDPQTDAAPRNRPSRKTSSCSRAGPGSKPCSASKSQRFCNKPSKCQTGRSWRSTPNLPHPTKRSPERALPVLCPHRPSFVTFPVATVDLDDLPPARPQQPRPQGSTPARRKSLQGNDGHNPSAASMRQRVVIQERAV